MRGNQMVMKVRKRSGTLEDVDINKILRAISGCAEGLPNVDPVLVATKTVGGLYDGATTRELDELSIRTAAAYMYEEPEYSRLAARLAARLAKEESTTHGIETFADCLNECHRLGLVNDRTHAAGLANMEAIELAIDPSRDQLFEYFGIKVLLDRYVLKHPEHRYGLETPQYMFMRVALGLYDNDITQVIELYHLMSKLDYLPSSPTLFNSGTQREQMSSCYLLDSPADDLTAIYDKYRDVAMLSKFAGGIGLSYSRVRAEGSYIKGTNGHSRGIVPFLKTLDSSVAAVNQCFLPGTLVQSSGGWCPIEDAHHVVSEGGELYPVQRNHTYEVSEEVITLTTAASPHPVTVTANHPFLACLKRRGSRDKLKAEWVDAKDLTKDHILWTPTLKALSSEYTKDQARFYGVMLGDGHICKNRNEAGVTLGHKKKDTLYFIENYLAELGVHTWKSEQKGCVSVRWTNNIDWLDYSMLYNDDGIKRVNKAFYNSSPEVVASIIKGLVETDGGVYRDNEVHFYTSSLPLCLSMQDMLRHMGALGSLCTSVGHRGTYGDTTLYDVSVPLVSYIAKELSLDEATKTKYFRYKDLVGSRVKSVETSSYSGKVYDLTVDGPENYTTTVGLAHNGGRRKGAACVYLETWHADIERFLELRDNTGDEQQRTHNLNIANWIPDLFMERVKEGGTWSLFDPRDVGDALVDSYGPEFEERYQRLEAEGKYTKQVPARDLYARMMRTLAQTGNGWMCFKDPSNVACNQATGDNVVHLSNLCTEILEVNHLSDTTSVCNLGSVNLGNHINKDGWIDYNKLGKTVRTAVRQLDRVINRNFYPIGSAEASNSQWRPVGLGCMGFQDALFKMGLPFDSDDAKVFTEDASSFIYGKALEASCELAEELGTYPAYQNSKTAQGLLQPDFWKDTTLPSTIDWEELRDKIRKHGLRNSLLIAVAPTATIASIAGCYECIEPQVSNLFKRETLSGEFLQVNRYLVQDLKRLNLWTPTVRAKIKDAEGSVQGVSEIPKSIRDIYKTAWELKNKTLIDLAAARGPYVDQSQSLNLFMESPTIGKLSSMYMYLWESGLKTSYYLRSRPATKIMQVSGQSTKERHADGHMTEEQLLCSLENPETCSACE